MNRRTFLRVIGSAAISAAIAPTLSADTPVQPFWNSRRSTDSGALTLQMIRDAYEKCSRGGNIGPEYMIVSSSTARQLGLLYDVDLEAVA